MAGTEQTITVLNEDMAFNIDLWEKVKLTHPIALEEWAECFIHEIEAELEIRETLTNREMWKKRDKNFLLRLISDDENGYANQRDKDHGKRPRVHLAMAFVTQMAECESTLIIEYLRETLSVQAREAGSTRSVYDNVQDEIAQESIRLESRPSDGVNPSLRKRGNGLIHEAAKNGRCAILQKLSLLTAENVDINCVNNIGETALHLAAEFEHIKDVEILLRAGAQLKVCELCVVL